MPTMGGLPSIYWPFIAIGIWHFVTAAGGNQFGLDAIWHLTLWKTISDVESGTMSLGSLPWQVGIPAKIELGNLTISWHLVQRCIGFSGMVGLLLASFKPSKPVEVEERAEQSCIGWVSAAFAVLFHRKKTFSSSPSKLDNAWWGSSNKDIEFVQKRSVQWKQSGSKNQIGSFCEFENLTC